MDTEPPTSSLSHIVFLLERSLAQNDRIEKTIAEMDRRTAEMDKKMTEMDQRMARIEGFILKEQEGRRTDDAEPQPERDPGATIEDYEPEQHPHQVTPSSSNMPGNNLVPAKVVRTIMVERNPHTKSRTPFKYLFQCGICNVAFNSSSSMEECIKSHAVVVEEQQDVIQESHTEQLCTSDPKRKSHERLAQQKNIQTSETRMTNASRKKQKSVEKGSPTNNSRQLGRSAHGKVNPRGNKSQFCCKLCGVRLLSKKTLDDHMKAVHLRLKPYQCDLCEKAFSQGHTLKAHRLIHTGEKPLSCPVCHKRFRVKDCLKEHLNIHTGQKPYSCKICDVKFRQRAGLYKHERSCHLENASQAHS